MNVWQQANLKPQPAIAALAALGYCLTAAVYVNLLPGLSWQGRMELRQGRGGSKLVAGERATAQPTALCGSTSYCAAVLRNSRPIAAAQQGKPRHLVHPKPAHRAWMAWHCVNRYGCRFPAVCSGGSHCTAEAWGDAANSMPTCTGWPARMMGNQLDGWRLVVGRQRPMPCYTGWSP